MTTLELLLKIHDAIGNTWPDISTAPPKIKELIPELRGKIRQLENGVCGDCGHQKCICNWN